MTERKFVVLDDLFRMPSTSHAVVCGDDVWVQGLLGTIGDGIELAPGGVGAETAQACSNVGRVLEACGARLDDIVRLDVLLASTSDFLECDAALDEHLPVRPARTVAYASALPIGARVEITARARL